MLICPACDPGGVVLASPFFRWNSKSKKLKIFLCTVWSLKWGVKVQLHSFLKWELEELRTYLHISSALFLRGEIREVLQRYTTSLLGRNCQLMIRVRSLFQYYIGESFVVLKFRLMSAGQFVTFTVSVSITTLCICEFRLYKYLYSYIAN